MENKTDERYIKITFTQSGMGIEAEKVSRADILCAMLGMAAELGQEDFKNVIKLIRKMGQLL